MAITGTTTCLWFDDEAGEATDFYVSLFPNSRIVSTSYYQDGAPKPAGTVLTVEFELFGQPFLALNAGPEFPHSPAISFQVFCDTQDEVDHLWDSLIDNGGQESMCGWCSDRFGVSWQVIPRALPELLGSPDPARSHQAWTAMMGMRKIIIADL